MIVKTFISSQGTLEIVEFGSSNANNKYGENITKK